MAGWKCEKCGKPVEGRSAHGAHIMPVTYAGTCADPENLLCLCPGCHSMGPNSAHQQPQQYVYWLDETFPGRYERVREKAIKYSQNPYPKIDWKEVRKENKKKLEELSEQST